MNEPTHVYPSTVPLAVGQHLGHHRHPCGGDIHVSDAAEAKCAICGKQWDAALRVVLTPR